MMNANDTPDGRLQLASQKNDVVGIRRELANGALHAPHPTVRPSAGLTCCWGGAGADVNYIDPVFTWTALHIASLDGKADAVEVGTALTPPTPPPPACSRVQAHP